MKLLKSMTAAIFMVVATGASAQSDELCEATGDIVRTLVEAREGGLPVEDAIMILLSNGLQPVLVEEIIKYTYVNTLGDTPEEAQQFFVAVCKSN